VNGAETSTTSSKVFEVQDHFFGRNVSFFLSLTKILLFFRRSLKVQKEDVKLEKYGQIVLNVFAY
jgi:hypothetical protein